MYIMLKFKQYILEGIGANVQGSRYTPPMKSYSMFTAMMNSLPHLGNVLSNHHKISIGQGHNLNIEPEDSHVFDNYLKPHVQSHTGGGLADPNHFNNSIKHLGVIPIRFDSHSPVHKFHIAAVPYHNNASYGGMYHGRSGATHQHHTGDHHHLITINSAKSEYRTDPEFHVKKVLMHELTHGLQHITGLGYSGNLDSWGYRGSSKKGTMRMLSLTVQEPDVALAPKRQTKERKKTRRDQHPDMNAWQSAYLHKGIEANARMLQHLDGVSREVKNFHLYHRYEPHVKNASYKIEEKAKSFNSETARQKYRQIEYKKLFDERSKYYSNHLNSQIRQLGQTTETDPYLAHNDIASKPIRLRQQKLREKQKRNRILMYQAVHDHHLNELIKTHSGGHDVLEFDAFNHTARRAQKREEKEKRRTKDRERKQRKQTGTQATTQKPIIFGQSDDARMHSRDHQNKIIDNIIKVKDENEMKQREEQKPKPGRVRRAIDTVKRVLGRVVGRE